MLPPSWIAGPSELSIRASSSIFSASFRISLEPDLILNGLGDTDGREM